MAELICRVTDPQGEVVKGAIVKAKDEEDNIFDLKFDKDENAYVNRDLESGTYTVTVKVDGYKDYTVDAIDLNVQSEVSARLTPVSISGTVTDRAGNPSSGIHVRSIDEAGEPLRPPVPTDATGKYYISDLTAGRYTVEVAKAIKENGNIVDYEPHPDYIAAHNVEVIAGRTTKGIDFSLDAVRHFIGVLDDARFNIETRISRKEANQAVSLFAVVNLMLAGLSQRMVGSESKTDILGVLNLYYGLQDKSLTSILPVRKPDLLWEAIGDDLGGLATELDQLQSDVDFLTQEGKRQFNLGTNTGVLGNVQFPRLFNRYVEVGTDPLLALNIKSELKNAFSDKEKIERAFDLLRELKGVILQIVRSLSKYGTFATSRVNKDWADFEARALEVLVTVAQERVSDDMDDLNPWSVLAVLTGKNRETDVAPHVVLGRHGVKLLQTAMDVYDEVEYEVKLEDFTREHLLELFQSGQDEANFRTTHIRRNGALVKRYPTTAWSS